MKKIAGPPGSDIGLWLIFFLETIFIAIMCGIEVPSKFYWFILNCLLRFKVDKYCHRQENKKSWYLGKQ